MNGREIALRAARALDDKKGVQIVTLDVSMLTVITDYLVIATGRSVPQVKALSDHVEEELAKADVFTKRKEGVSAGHWIVLDYGDVMVHIFHEKDREYYQLENLWSNGENRISKDEWLISHEEGGEGEA